MEEWKIIKDFENYQISNFGRVQNIHSGKILSQSVTKDGYLRIGLRKSYKPYKQKLFLVHRLVAENFLDEPSTELKETASYTKYQKVLVNHKDGVKTNNHIDNLEWTTYKSNTKHAVVMGLQTGKKGESNSESKLSDDQVRSILKEYKNSNGYRGIQTSLANEYNVSKGTIWKIINRKSWTHIK